MWLHSHGFDPCFKMADSEALKRPKPIYQLNSHWQLLSFLNCGFGHH